MINAVFRISLLAIVGEFSTGVKNEFAGRMPNDRPHIFRTMGRVDVPRTAPQHIVLRYNRKLWTFPNRRRLAAYLDLANITLFRDQHFSTVKLGLFMKTQIIRTKLVDIEQQWTALYFATVGLVAGFLGSITKLVANMVGASLLNLESTKLLRVYATLKEGPGAMVASNGIPLTDTFLMHLGVGSALGAVFLLFMTRRDRIPAFKRFLMEAVVYGLVVWVTSFYLVLIWLQPLIDGEAYIVNSIPWWVAMGSHALYGCTVGVVSFPFLGDVDGSADRS